jgi:thiamine biosynthesis lipoprotein
MTRACDSSRRARPLLGTFVEIAGAGAPQSDLEAAVDAAFEAVTTVHRLMSFHESSSDVSGLNRDAAAHPVSVHPWTYRVLETALDLHRCSAGVFDIAIARAGQELGWLPCDADDRPPSASSVSCGSGSIELLPACHVRFHEAGTRIDLGGIAKGFAVDRAIDVLQAHGVPRGLVNAGGDLAAYGPDAPAVHIRDPRDPRQAMCRVEVRDGALASTSGRFDPFQADVPAAPAVLDPRTREQAQTIAGATVRAPSCMIADALTKVVVIAGEASIALLRQYAASALFISVTGHVSLTRDWPHRVHLAD